MDSTQFIAASKVVIVAGKGGVGKTTVTGAVALMAARNGIDVLAVEVDGSRALSRFLTTPDAGGEPTPSPILPDRLSVAAIDPANALAAYLDEQGLRRLANRLERTGMLDLVATATPGIRDLVVLGRIRQLADRHPDHLVVVDAPAAGHAVMLLRTPADVMATASSGRLRDQAEASAAFLGDGVRVGVLLVTLPRETPVNETVETAFALEDEVGVALLGAVVNMVERPIDPAGSGTAWEFLRSRIAAETEQLTRLESGLPLPMVVTDRTDSAPATAADFADAATQLERWLA